MINITKRGMRHTLKHHTLNQFTKYRRRSKFNANVDLMELINMASQCPSTRLSNGNLLRTFDAGKKVGAEHNTGKTTCIVTVITRPNGDRVTKFPGHL
jgi:hypothetical protein